VMLAKQPYTTHMDLWLLHVYTCLYMFIPDYTCLYMFIPPIYGKLHSYKDKLFHGDPGYPFGFSSTFRRGSRTHFFHDSLVQKTGKHIIYIYSYEHMFFGSIILVGPLVLFHNSISYILFYNWIVCSTITFSCGSLQDEII
jgi:hypothetical protein